jgi:tetratricopeptide (TPR) repeat protein
VHGEGVFKGEAAARLRLALGNLAPADRDRNLRKIWSQVLPSTSIEKVTATFDEQTAHEQLTMDGSTRLEWSHGRYKLEGLIAVDTRDFTRTPGPHNDAPFSVPFPTYTRIVETITLPHAPAPFTVEGGQVERTLAGVELRRLARIQGDVLTVEMTARALVPEVPFAGAQDAQKTLREITDSSIYLHAPSGYVEARKQAVPATPAVADPVGVHIRLGNDWLNRREYDKAIGEFDTALNLDPVAALALADRGMAHMWKEEHELARQDFDKAVAIDPRNAVVPRGRGMLALREGRLPEAVADFTASLALAQNNAFTLEWRAVAYRQSGDYEKALADNAAAIRLQPGSFGRYVFRASVLRGQARVDEALQQAEAVVAANPDNPGAYVAAAQIDSASGKDAQAMQSLERSLAIAPTVQAYLTRARYRPRADLAGRRADADAALALDFNSVPVRILLASVQVDASEYDGAVLTLNKAMSIYGETPQLLTWRGIAYAKSNQPALAAGDFAAARTKATRAGALNDMCWNMAMAGVAFDTALSACDAAVAQLPNDAAILDSRAFVLLRLGRYDEAIAAYNAALQAGGDKEASLYGRGMAKDLQAGAAAGAADIKSALALDARIATTFADSGVKP